MPLENDLARLLDNIDARSTRTPRGGVYVTLFVGILDTIAASCGTSRGPQPAVRAAIKREHRRDCRRPACRPPLSRPRLRRRASWSCDDADLLFFYTDGMVEAENEQATCSASTASRRCSSPSTRLASTDLSTARPHGAGVQGGGEPFGTDATMMALRLGPRSALVSEGSVADHARRWPVAARTRLATEIEPWDQRLHVRAVSTGLGAGDSSGFSSNERS